MKIGNFEITNENAKLLNKGFEPTNENAKRIKKGADLGSALLRASNKMNKCQDKKCKSVADELDEKKHKTKYEREALKKLYASNDAKKLGTCLHASCHRYLDELLQTSLATMKHDCKLSKTANKLWTNERSCKKLERFENEYKKTPRNYANLYSLYLEFMTIYDP